MEQHSGALLQTLVLGLAAAAVLLLLLQQWRSRTKLRLPPGPGPLPVLGNLLLLAGSKYRHRDLYKLAERYGPIMFLRMGTRKLVVVQSPELAMEVLKQQDLHLRLAPSAHLRHGRNVQQWQERRVRALCPPPEAHEVMRVELLSRKRITDFQHVRLEELARMVEAIRSPVGQPVNLGYLLGTLNLNNITRMSTGKAAMSTYKVTVEDPQHAQQHLQLQAPTEPGQGNVENKEDFVHLIRGGFQMSSMQGIGDAIPWLSFLDTWFILPKAKMKQTKSRMDAFYSRVIQEHRRYHAANPGCQPRDFVDVLLGLSSSTGEALTDEMIMSQLSDMVGGGTDTSSSTTEWAMAELLRQPALLEQTVREVEQVVGRGRDVAESDIPNLPFLQAVVKETLRMHPAAPLLLPHHSTQAATVGGYHIPANTTVLVNAWALSRDPAAWKNPDQFRPQRFLPHDPDTTAEVDIRGHHFQLLPFGSGKRICPGMELGLTMVPLTLATLLHSFTWSLPSDVQRPEDLDMGEHQGIVVQRAQPLKAVPHPKADSKATTPELTT